MTVIETDRTVRALISSTPSGVRRHRWTRDEFYRAITLGFFKPDERWELIDGDLYEQMGENPPHSHACRRCRRQLETAFLGLEYFVSEQHPVTLPDDTEPEPDIAVIAGTLNQFAHCHPSADDILLIVEVSATTLDFDRLVKAPAYAASRIAEYWILNLEGRRLEVHRSPQDGAYTSVVTIPETGAVSPLAAPNAVIAVADLLP
jgi:Uma2 family endonuclease